MTLSEVLFKSLTPPKCERCGLCCKIGPCPQGKESKTGKCIELKKKGKIYSCGLLEKGKLDQQKAAIGRGCPLKLSPKAYELYNKEYGRR
jgi:hypothetical protein